MKSIYSILSYDQNEILFNECATIEDVLNRAIPGQVHWITLSGITLQDDFAAVGQLLEYFQLSPQLATTIFAPERQPFEGEYDDCLYMEYSILLHRSSLRAHKRVSGSIIQGTHYLILLEKTPSGLFERTRKRILERHTQSQSHGPDYLLYLIIKTIMVNYQEIFKNLTERFEALEDEVIGHPAREYVYDQILDLREEFKPLHGHLLDLMEFVDTLREEESRFIGKEVKKRFTKTTAREAKDLMGDYQFMRSWVAELIEIHRANVNESTNRVMKTLTVISTIFLPLTFIAGVYGMNFDNIPELHWEWGYPVVMFFMLSLAVSALIFMRSRKWL